MDTVSYQDGSNVHFTYAQHDRLQTMVDSLGTTIYQRDAAGRVTSVTDAGGNQVTYTYDALNRLKTVQTGWARQRPTPTTMRAGWFLSPTSTVR